MLAKVFSREALWPIGNSDKDPVAPDRWAGLVVVAFYLIGRKNCRLPENVLLCLAPPDDRQVYFVGLTHAGGAAPAGPVLARVCGGGDDGNYKLIKTPS